MRHPFVATSRRTLKPDELQLKDIYGKCTTVDHCSDHYLSGTSQFWTHSVAFGTRTGSGNESTPLASVVLFQNTRLDTR